MKETWSEADPLARYVHSNHIVYESLVAFVRGDDPLKDASNERVGALKDAKASDEYVSFWRHRYEVAFKFFSGRPQRPQLDSMRPYSPHPEEQRAALRCANDDAFALFGKDPVAEHEKQVKLAQLQAAANHQRQIDQHRHLWEAKQRAGVPLQSNDDRIDARSYNFGEAPRISDYSLNVIEPSLSLIRITDLGA